MNNNQIPTAEEFLLEYDKEAESYNEAGVLRDFAKLHVQAALTAANDKVKEELDGTDWDWWEQEEAWILNAYPLNLIQ